MPGRRYDHGAFGHDRCCFFLIHIIYLPVPLEIVHKGQHLTLPVRINGFHGHRLASHVHVRLKVFNAGRCGQHKCPLSHRDFIRRYVQAVRPLRVEHTQNSAVLGRLIMKPDAQLNLSFRHSFSIRMQMHFPHDLRPGHHQFTRIRTKNLASFTHRPFHKETRSEGHVNIFRQASLAVFLLQQECQRVMHHSTAGIILGADFDGFYPALLGKSGRRHRAKPFVLGDGGQIIGLRCDHQVRRATHLIFKAPDQRIVELNCGRCQRRITLRCTLIDPSQNRGALCLSQAPVVGKLLNADLRIDVPGRHHTIFDAIANHRRKQLGFLIGQQRHRRDGVGPVALLTFLLKNRSNIAGPGDLTTRFGLPECPA